MTNVAVFKMQSYFEGKSLLEFLEAGMTEYTVDLKNCVNSHDGNFMQLKIYKFNPDDGKKNLVAEADTRYPGMIRIPDENVEVIESLKDILKGYHNPILILSNCSNESELQRR